MQAAVLLAKGIAYSWTLMTWRFTGVYILIAQRGQKKKIIIICKIKQLFCQVFQHHNHSFANRFAVSQ